MRARLPWWLVLALAGGLASCEFSQPPAAPGSRTAPCWVLKFVPWASDGRVLAYFTLADAATNQVASGGDLRVQVYTTTAVSLGGGTPSGGGMNLKRTLYDNTFAIGATNFHWETFGGLFTVKDLAFRFAVPYEAMKGPVHKGRSATIQIEFHPEGATNALLARKNITFY